MKETFLAFIQNPLTTLASSATSLFAGIGTCLGIFNAVLGCLVVLVTLATAVVGLLIKIKQYRSNDKDKE